MKKFNKNYGDIFDVKEYIKFIKNGSFTDYDGIIGECLDENNNIVRNECNFNRPSDIEEFKIIIKIMPEIKKVVWYNR